MDIKKINDERKRQRISVAELAKRANLPKGTVEKVLFGIVKHPRIDTMQAIENALGFNAPTWTTEDRALGVTDAITRKLTADEDKCNTLFKEIGKKKGANAQALALKVLEQILNN